MKKTIIIIVLIGMFGYAVYDLAYDNEKASPEVSEDLELETGAVNFEPPEDAVVGLEVGNIAPDFELKTLSGETAKLSDYRGKPVMLNFWATWCPPCRAEMPDMEKFYQNEEVNVLAVNLTQTENRLEDVPEFVDDFGLSFPIFLDEEIEVATMYQIRPIPTSFMINSRGVITQVAYGPLNYELMVQELEKMT